MAPLKFALKSVSAVLVVVAASWLLAIFWSAHGDWWIHAQTDTFLRIMLALVGPALSPDVALAEDQLHFWMFWIPSFAFTSAIFFVQRDVRRRRNYIK